MRNSVLFRSIIATSLLATGGVVGLAADPASATDPNADDYRAQYHFTVPDHWMNDPQRPVYVNGKYNFYYLYDEDYNGNAGPTSWRRATTTDMVTFHDEGIAIPEGLPEGTPMSGSVVIDENNTAGFGAGTLVALVSQDDKDNNYRQSQFLYYSTDGGDTFTLFGSDPVIPNTTGSDFRDPKVVWDDANDQWVAVITQASRIVFYTSDDLLSWTQVSDFDAPNVDAYECPDLFQIRADDNTMKWVLGSSANAEAYGGPHTFAYWPGAWDGTNFTADNTTAQWLDRGHDWYAAVTWPDESATNLDRRFAIGWMNTWGYEDDTLTWPNDGFNGTDSIVREIELKVQPDSSYSLASQPISALDDYATNTIDYGDVNVNGFTELPYHGTSYRIDTDITWSSLTNVGISTRRSPDGSRRIETGYYDDYIYLNREHMLFQNGEKHAPYSASATSVHLTVLVDTTSVEVFVDDGYQVLTDQTFLDPSDTGLALYTDGGAATFHDVTITEFADVMTLSDPGTPYEDFESGYDGWTSTGTAFGSGPAGGTLPDQQVVTGYEGSGLVNSFLSGDSTTGTLTSGAITVTEPYLNFLVGGGDHPTPSQLFADFETTSGFGTGWSGTNSFSGQGTSTGSLTNQVGARTLDTFVNGGDPATGTISSPPFTITRGSVDFLLAGGNHPWPSGGNTSVNLVIEGDVYRSATGDDSGTLRQIAWDVHSLIGKTATIQVVDNATGAWGHIMVDQIMFGDHPNAVVGESNTPTAVNLLLGGQVVRTVSGLNRERLHWVSWDLTDFTGQNVQIQIVDQNTGSWGHINADQFTFSDRPAA